MNLGGAPDQGLLAELDALIGAAPGAGSWEAPPAEEERTPTAPAPGPREPPSEPPAAEPAGRAATVLVVDDNQDYRKVVSYLLRGAGHEVLEAPNGAEGLRLARSRRVDLVLLDYEMPGLNGYELVQELRSLEETRKVRLVMLTGAKNRRCLKSLGMDVEAFLEKPIANEELLRAIAKVLGVRAAPEKPPEAAAPAAPAPSLLGEASEDAGDLLIEEQKKEKEDDQLAGLDVLANDSPLVNRVNKILVTAVGMNASDIHIEPQEKQICVRTRMNGSLKTLCQLPLSLAPQIAARVKIMSNLVITERRRPQDGQIRAMIKGRKVEFRVSTIPSIHGEKIVMRILGGSKLKPSLKDYDLLPRDLEVMERALDSPHGLLLITGPTGSGKTTTLYTMLRMLNNEDVNIMTAEDPVEYELPGITQVQVKAPIGLTFESILRSFLRQDPDIMLVGEIRDLETAEIAVKAAVTGHLVLSTLHTNSAPASLTRMTHMGVAPFLLADSVKLIVAQRLVKTLCKDCRREKAAPEDLLGLLRPEERERLKTVRESAGCEKCGRTGYSGRKPLFEVMELRSPEIRQMIIEKASVDAVTAQAKKEGMIELREAALRALAAGDTSVDEARSIILS